MSLKPLSAIVVLAAFVASISLVGCSSEANKPEDSMEGVLKGAHIDPVGKSKSQGNVSKDNQPATGQSTGSTGQ